MALIPWPGRMVYIEFPAPRVDSASVARVEIPGWPLTKLGGLGLMSGWWPTTLLGRTAQEAEQRRADHGVVEVR
jgi:hypothetical protein